MVFIVISIILTIGICIGSFINVCIYRIPNRQSIAFPPSHCQDCQHPLRWKDLIPILSYLRLKGKCGYCGEKISPQYPIIELLNGGLYLGLFLKYGWTPLFFVWAILTSLLLTVTIIDLRHQIIPDECILFGLVVGILLHIISVYDISILSGLIGFLVGGGIFLTIALVTKGAMGGGDIKLMAMLGLWFGTTDILVIALLSFFIGAIMSIFLIIFKLKTRKDMIPFGPFIALATLIVILYGQEILTLYYSW